MICYGSLINGADRAQCFPAVLSGRNVCSANKKEGVGMKAQRCCFPFAPLFLLDVMEPVRAKFTRWELDDVGFITTGF